MSVAYILRSLCLLVLLRKSWVLGSLYNHHWGLPEESSGADRCRCYPGDSCWPSPETWADFNQTLHGKLLATVPLASPCHDDKFAEYNAAECQKLRDVWLEPQTHYVSSSSVMAPLFANRSCDPFLAESARCIIGTYVSYAVNVSKASDVIETIHFATHHNIRLVIRNTGHE